MKAPKVLAKGPYRVAERIVKIAKENRIPVVQNIPLARAIYKTVDIGQEISPDLYLAMAEILAYVYKLRGKPPVSSRISDPQPA
jgi:flagellar biosynthetic protein FlhB